MYHPRLRSIHSPLTPIPPMSQQSSFDFSPAAINRCLEASKSTTPSVLKSRRNYTPSFLELSPPDISPIDYIPNSANRIVVSPNSTIGSNNSLSKCGDQISCDLDDDQPDSFNASNINNRHLNISSVLDEIGMKQYKSLFETEEIDLMAFLLLTDGDLEEIGVEDTCHRELFTGAIEKLNSMLN
ncbi:ankyrin repeat and SAM domain-containing protein 6-like [Bradysia coprophila]|uniref:ankyrin repeat and SAM domain-containing protein 6-like n=1 Tax=Bradysia coprophila TaxID=38358 RepID=UPI00187DC300|nr:ankyrin repeat and SAM domain-containing protein 6-like [Bradysia coprophila]